jgi:hypothetical protein
LRARSRAPENSILHAKIDLFRKVNGRSSERVKLIADIRSHANA